jgi:hypothetical protein
MYYSKKHLDESDLSSQKTENAKCNMTTKNPEDFILSNNILETTDQYFLQQYIVINVPYPRVSHF